jgi:hypothetical protein
MRNTAMLIIGSRHGRRDSGACPPLQKEAAALSRLGVVSFPVCGCVCVGPSRLVGGSLCLSLFAAGPALPGKKNCSPHEQQQVDRGVHHIGAGCWRGGRPHPSWPIPVLIMEINEKVWVRLRVEGV